jgi:hypothetical protein
MKKILLFTLLLSAVLSTNAQTTWAGDAAEVLYNNCTSCHNPNGIAPSSLMSYAEASTYAPLIQSYVTNNIMPPWTADTSYQHFSQERVMTQSERDILLNWINEGSLEGDLNQAPPTPIYNGSQQLSGTPDLVITAPNYMSKASNSADDYVCFVMPSGLAQNRKVRAVEVIPGNLNTVHHCLVYTDPSLANTTDTTGGNCGGPVAGDLMMGYTPGATPTVFPASSNFSSGMIIEAGADVVFAMHYPEGSYGTWDQTKVNFYFYDEPVANFREIFAEPIIEDWGFTINANTIDSVEVNFNNVVTDFTMLSVFPHMHLIGQKIESHAVTPANEVIPFVRIPHWDFEWQDFYWFEYMKKIPANSTIYGKGVYDNTVNNIHNPFSPPQNVSAGLNTTDEMFLIYYHYMVYQAGDEDVNVDSLTTIFLSEQDYSLLNSEISVYPNPFTESTSINFNLNKASFVSLYIYDLQGKIINKLERNNLSSGEYNYDWNGNNSKGNKVANGVYFYSMMIDGKHYSGKIISQQ